MRAKTRVLLIVALLVVLLTVPASVRAKDVVVVGTSPDYPPMEFVQDKTLVGFDIDLVRAIAEEAGFVVKFKVDEFDNLIPDLASKNPKYDMVASSLTIWPPREEIMDFSDPYWQGPKPADDWWEDYEHYGFGFPTDSPLRAEVNAALDALGQDGTYEALYQKWFGEAPVFVP